MAKKKTAQEEDIYIQVDEHYQQWVEDNDTRRTRPNGWDDVTDAYWGRLPSDWPYLSKVIDPRIRTSLLEKNARLLNSKLRGRLVPREGGDVLGARIHNAILDFQWDNANDGGSMLEKWGQMDLDTRLYASRFGLVKWRHCEKDGKVVFDGNEFTPLDLRDCGMDQSAEHIRNAKWFQHREWAFIEDLEYENDLGTGQPKYPGLQLLRDAMTLDQVGSYNSDRRDNEYVNRILQLKGLTDRLGDDRSFPVVELVTEYREDRWITFAPRYRVIIRDIKNPYKHKKIPVVQLRYYKITGDPLGESEVEPVLPLWRAIQATLCGYLDNMNLHIRPPLKILEGQARLETIIFGPEAQWIVNRVDAVTEHQGNNSSIQYFQATYSSLVAAFNTAMGDLSQGISNVDPFNPDKTATEVKASQKQQNMRDQKNQTSLSEALTDMMSMWTVNNKQFLFSDENKQQYVQKILGGEMFEYFKRSGLDEMEVTDESMKMIGDIVMGAGDEMTDQDVAMLYESAKQPKYPIIDNPEETNPEKYKVRAKMSISDLEDSADIVVIPEDLEGNYDYIADVKSMAAGENEAQQEALKSAIDLTINPQVIQLMQQQGVIPDIKELLIASYERSGLKDSERYFQTQDASTGPIAAAGQGLTPNLQDPRIPTNTPPSPQGVVGGQAPQPAGLPF